MPWYDKAEMLAILSNHTVTHHYTVAEFCRCPVQAHSGSKRQVDSKNRPMEAR